jgi:hypothetical protein
LGVNNEPQRAALSSRQREHQEFATAEDAVEHSAGQRRAETRVGEVSDHDCGAGQDGLGGRDGLAKDAAIKDFLDDFELGEFRQRRPLVHLRSSCTLLQQLLVQWAAHGQVAAVQHMDLEYCTLIILVSQQCLHGADAVSVFHQWAATSATHLIA